MKVREFKNSDESKEDGIYGIIPNLKNKFTHFKKLFNFNELYKIVHIEC